MVPAREGTVHVDAVIAHVREAPGRLQGAAVRRLRSKPLPRNPGGKARTAQLREETDWGDPLR